MMTWLLKLADDTPVMAVCAVTAGPKHAGDFVAVPFDWVSDILWRSENRIGNQLSTFARLKDGQPALFWRGDLVDCVSDWWCLAWGVWPGALWCGSQRCLPDVGSVGKP